MKKNWKSTSLEKEAAEIKVYGIIGFVIIIFIVISMWDNHIEDRKMMIKMHENIELNKQNEARLDSLKRQFYQLQKEVFETQTHKSVQND